MIKTMKLALEALKDNQHLVADNERHAYVMEYNAIIEKLEEALAKQGEPVKLVAYNCTCGKTMKFESEHGIVAQQRTWVGLTEDEIDDIFWQHENRIEHQVPIYPYERAIEAKLKQKNNG